MLYQKMTRPKTGHINVFCSSSLLLMKACLIDFGSFTNPLMMSAQTFRNYSINITDAA